MPTINLAEKFALFADHWSPKIVGEINDYHIKLAKVQGAFPWHKHEETDELFMVIKGELTIQMRDGDVTLREGELYIVPKGVEHAPCAEEECEILLLEPAGTVNTGDADAEGTTGEWI
ncbi:MAG: cupin domain-containing protein [Alphaproteobacteria bacterium]|nr:MAG: cupin domain-containing protein [Alphaproteobacteria bacterium]